MLIMQSSTCSLCKTQARRLVILHRETTGFSGFGAFNWMLPSHTHSILQLSKPRPRPRRGLSPSGWDRFIASLPSRGGRAVPFMSRRRIPRGAKLCPGAREDLAGGRDISSNTSSPKKPHLPKSFRPHSSYQEQLKTRNRAGVQKPGPLTNSSTATLQRSSAPGQVCTQCLSSVPGHPTAVPRLSKIRVPVLNHPANQDVNSIRALTSRWAQPLPHP